MRPFSLSFLSFFLSSSRLAFPHFYQEGLLLQLTRRKTDTRGEREIVFREKEREQREIFLLSFFFLQRALYL